MVERTLIPLPSQLQLIERLQHLIYLSSSLIFVSGEAGSGKSTLTESLSNSLNIDLQQIYVPLSNQPTAESLRQHIIAQLFDDPLFNAEDRLLDTIIRLQSEEDNNTNKLIIIDDAEKLPEGFIIELCELFAADSFIKDNTFNLLLLTDETTNQHYVDYLEENLVSRIHSSLNHVEFKLPALNAQESLMLLQHNFQEADYQAEVQHQDALHHQLTLCHGNPQKIIQLATQLTEGASEPEKNYWLKTALPAILLMLLLIAIVSAFASYFYPQFIAQQMENKVTSPDVINTNIEIKKTTVDKQDVSNTSSNVMQSREEQLQEQLAASWDEPITTDETEANSTEPAKIKTSYALADKALAALNTSIEEIPETNVNNTITSIEIVKPAVPEVPEVVVENEVDDRTLLSALNENKLLENKPVESPQQVAVTKPSITPIKAAKVAKVTPLEEQPLPASSTVKRERVSTVPEFTPTNILFAKSANKYTLQLSGMASKRYFSLFKQTHQYPQDNLYVYQTIYKNKPWYVVLYGEYDSIKAAQVAAKNLPDEFKNMPNWVKKWQVVHNELRLNNE